MNQRTVSLELNDQVTMSCFRLLAAEVESLDLYYPVTLLIVFNQIFLTNSSAILVEGLGVE